MADSSDRESIWSVRKDDIGLYSGLFLSLWILGMLYYWPSEFCWQRTWLCVLTNIQVTWVWLVKEAGLVGLSSAVISLVTVAVSKEGIMPLFNVVRGRIDKKVEAARKEGLAEGRAEVTKWIAWNARREEAERMSLDFNEPPPSETADRADERG